MQSHDPRLDTTHRTRDAHERPREYNDPSRLDTQPSFYDGPHLHWAKLVLLAVPAIAVVAVIGFIIFNLISN